MAILTWGDTHFWHNNILKPEYDNRPFDTIEDMNNGLIKAWNEAVGPDDIMIHMGDFFFQGTRHIDEIYPLLNGKEIKLIIGNHDYKKQLNVLSKYDNFTCVRHLDFWYKGIHFWCAHNPCDEWFNNVDWSDTTNLRCSAHWHSSAPKGAQFNWRGTPWNDKHRHQGTTETNEVFLPGLSYNVSLDVIDYKPISLDKICEDIVKKKKELAEQGTF